MLMNDSIPISVVENVLKASAAKRNTEQRITYTQAYEISTKVAAEVDSKGNIKPSAQVTITRKLEDGEEIRELIHADVLRGLEEVRFAIDEVLKRGGQ